MKYYLIIITLLISLCTTAQDLSHLYAVGSAVPGGIQELVAFPNKQFKFAGPLQEGTLFIRNFPQHKVGTRYLKPSYEDSYIVNNGLPYTLSMDSTTALWTVPLSEDVYRFTVDLNSKTIKGELFRPWNELFIVGGATECGWVTYTFLPFTRDENEVCTWDWTGELKERPEYGEPRRFKFNGQNAWDPKVLHPFTKDEDILQTTQLLTNGSGDNKWQISKEGYYHIRVDVFRETVEAEYLGTSLPGNTENSLQDINHDITLQTNGNQIIAKAQRPFVIEIYSADANKIFHESGTTVSTILASHGLYIIKITSGCSTLTKKIVL